MALMRTSNPALKEGVFDSLARTDDGAMTIHGTVNRTAFLLLLVVLAASWTWSGASGPWILVGALGGMVLGLVTCFQKAWSPVTAPLYALCEGLFLGGISAFYEARFPGIVVPSVGLTFGVLTALLAAYASRLVQPSENFKLGVVAATGGIALFYLLMFVMGLFGVHPAFFHGSSPVSIAISAAVAVIAALNLVLDFDFIEQGAESGAPKYMEWYGAFGLLVTLVWLYLEILRLLSKLRSRN